MNRSLACLVMTMLMSINCGLDESDDGDIAVITAPSVIDTCSVNMEVTSVEALLKRSLGWGIPRLPCSCLHGVFFCCITIHGPNGPEELCQHIGTCSNKE